MEVFLGIVLAFVAGVLITVLNAKSKEDKARERERSELGHLMQERFLMGGDVMDAMKSMMQEAKAAPETKEPPEKEPAVKK